MNLRPLRTDGKIIDKQSKSIFVLEMLIPWILNGANRHKEKSDKYRRIIQSLVIENRGYSVKQLTFIIECMGGFSKDGWKPEIHRIYKKQCSFFENWIPINGAYLQKQTQLLTNLRWKLYLRSYIFLHKIIWFRNKFQEKSKINHRR